MQHNGQKIKRIAKKKGIAMKWLAEHSGWSEAGPSQRRWPGLCNIFNPSLK